MEEFRALCARKDAMEAEIASTLDAMGPDGLTMDFIDGAAPALPSPCFLIQR